MHEVFCHSKRIGTIRRNAVTAKRQWSESNLGLVSGLFAFIRSKVVKRSSDATTWMELGRMTRTAKLVWTRLPLVRDKSGPAARTSCKPHPGNMRKAVRAA